MELIIGLVRYWTKLKNKKKLTKTEKKKLWEGRENGDHPWSSATSKQH
jgi:hypothetical protein